MSVERAGRDRVRVGHVGPHASIRPCPSRRRARRDGPPRVPARCCRRRCASGEIGLARGLDVLAHVNQVDGFDCPGCAWPEPLPRHRLEFCENGAKAVAHEATRKRVTRELFAAHHASTSSRPRTTAGSRRRAGSPSRCCCRRAPSSYEPIALGRTPSRCIAEHLRALGSPDEAIFYTSGRTSNEAAFLWQLFARAFGTNNLPDCSNMCHESSGDGTHRDDRRRQGHGRARRLRRCRPDPRDRPEPGHEPPAHAHALLQAAKRRGCDDRRASTRCASAGWCGSRIRRRRSACSASAPRSPTCSCRCASAATSRSCRAWRRRCSSSRPRRRAACSTTRSSSAHTDGFDDAAARRSNAPRSSDARARERRAARDDARVRRALRAAPSA